MTMKASISLTDAQEAFARSLVAEGRYPSLSAVLQHGLDLLRSETEAREAETAALWALLAERQAGAFVPDEAARDATRVMLARRRAGHELAR